MYICIYYEGNVLYSEMMESERWSWKIAVEPIKIRCDFAEGSSESQEHEMIVEEKLNITVFKTEKHRLINYRWIKQYLRILYLNKQSKGWNQRKETIEKRSVPYPLKGLVNAEQLLIGSKQFEILA